MSQTRTVTVAHFRDVVSYPPVLSLIENLLDHGHRVNLVSYHIERMPARILEHPAFSYRQMQEVSGGDPFHRLLRGQRRIQEGRSLVEEFMRESDLLWTTTDLTVRVLGETCLKYPHVMQLMELIEWYPQFYQTSIRFPIETYARQARRVVVPEINRAHIEAAWWQLPKVPTVLPNKPYRLDPGELSEETKRAVSRMRREKRHILLYLGSIAPNRSFDTFARAVAQTDGEFALYVAGGVVPGGKKLLHELRRQYPGVVHYLGSFPAPQHLALVQEADLGLLTYKAAPYHNSTISVLNSVYCAPNKLFEYAGYGVPMIGNAVPGLMGPIERWQMGEICDADDPSDIAAAMHRVMESHEQMSQNARRFYDSVDLGAIVEDIVQRS